MTIRATSAFAPAFTHTSAAPDVTFTFASGTTPVMVSLSTGTYRMWLTTSATCYLRALAAAITTALTTARAATYTCIASLSASGVVLLRIVTAAGLPTGVTFAAPMWRALGYASATPTLSAGSGLVDVTGSLPVWYLALLTTVKHGHLQPHQAGGSERTTGGRVYTIAASATSYSLACTVRYQPSTPAYRSSLGCEATAMQPATDYLGALGQTGTAREWSVLDVLQVARNATCAVALDNWQAIRTSTSESYYLADIDTVLSPKIDSPDERWGAFAECPLSLVLPTTGQTGTRV